MIPEDLDLAAISRDLHRALGPGEPVGYLRGKAKMRDALVDLHGFSQLEAESLVGASLVKGAQLQALLHERLDEINELARTKVKAAGHEPADLEDVEV